MSESVFKKGDVVWYDYKHLKGIGILSKSIYSNSFWRVMINDNGNYDSDLILQECYLSKIHNIKVFNLIKSYIASFPNLVKELAMRKLT